MSKLMLNDVSRGDQMVARLIAGGLSHEAASEKALLLEACAGAAIKAGFGGGPVRVLFVPGRIEVLGKHTDYAGGRSLLATAEKGFCFVAAARSDRRVRMTDTSGKHTAEFDIDPELTPPLGQWSNYPMTVVRRIARNFPGDLRGADIAFASDLPPAAGMSSSSALLVASFLTLSAINDLPQRPQYKQNIRTMPDLAGYLGTCENGQSFGTLVGDKGVGTFGGSEDHTAILNCQAGHLSQYSYCPVRFECSVPVPGDYVFAIGASGVVAEKTGEARDKFNRASALSAAVVQAWRDATGRSDPHMAAAIASSPDAAEQFRAILGNAGGGRFRPDELLRRFEHFYSESQEIIPTASAALARGDVAAFGAAVDRSQSAGATLLGNQVSETVFLAESARRCGACAASAFGAGFGGAVWALVAKDLAADLLKDWAEQYRRAFPEAAARANFFLTSAGPAAFEVA